MIKFLTITKTAWIAFFVAFIAAFIMAATTYGQESPEDVAQKYGVTFPITELGGCTDYSACRSYCEDPVNATACINYAKQKGFYQEDKFEVKDNVLQAAQQVLGCDSKTACLNFCEVPANHDKCDSFAKSQGLVGGRVEDPSKTQVISKAREVLGCDSATGCQSLCSKEENRQKCSEFAKTVGLHGGETKVGPGGCTSEGTCKSFCSDPQNFQICKGFHDVAGGQFTGPGGCDSEASCRTYCQQNEAECSKAFGGPVGYNPTEMCNRTPNCAWTNNGCQCGFYGETKETAQKAGEYAGFCKANPDKCRPGQTGGFDTTNQRQEFESYCRQNPDKCKPPTTGGTTGDVFDPATQCTRYGCTWTNNTCQCSGIHPYSYPTPSDGGTYSPPPYQSPGTYYQYPTPGTYSPPPYSYQSPGTYYQYPTPTYGSPSGSCPAGQYIGPGGYCISGSGGGTYYSYPTPSYGSPSYGSPTYGSPSYGSPSYGTPEQPSYGSPSYGSPSYGSPVQGVSTQRGLFEQLWDFLTK